MLHDPSADAAPDEPVPAEPLPDEADVVEWGDDAFSRRPPRRRTSLRGFDRLRGDRRLVPLTVAALGVAAVFGSVVAEWGTVSLLEESGVGPPTRQELSTAASNLGGLAAAYLVGVLAVVALTSLAFFGTPSIRPNARVAGAATTGGLLALLVATTVSLEDVVRRAFFFPPDMDFQVGYGRGLILAYLGTAAIGLALYLVPGSAGRSPGAEPATTSAAEPATGPDLATNDPGPAGSVGRRRSRPDRSGSEEDVREVTVRPTSPFARPEWEDRYR